MSTSLNNSKLITVIFVPMILSLALSAFVNLQFFQDGSSYILELQVSDSAIRHNRFSVLAIQGPTILIYKVLNRLQVDPDLRFKISRLTFNLSYALIPLISLTLSWLVVRRRRESLLIWAALIILLINLVNFSWVSELLIALQLSCSLLLASILVPGTKAFWIFTVILLPTIFLLHPLVALIFAAIAVSTAYTGYKNANIRTAAWSSTIVFFVAAMLRGAVSFFMLTPYESDFLESSAMNDYLLTTSLENKIVLLTAIIIGMICLTSKSLITYKRTLSIVLLLTGIIQIVSIILFFINLSFLPNYLQLAGSTVGVAGAIIYQYRPHRSRQSSAGDFRILYDSCIALTVIVAGLLVSQYFSGSGVFPLKTGLTLFVGALLMVMAAIDTTSNMSEFEAKQRLRIVQVLAIIFSFVIVSKSLIWQSAEQQLTQTLVASDEQCLEIDSKNFPWLEQNPYNIINNWSLPTLALQSQNIHPRKLLLEKNACQIYRESGIVHLDPWTDLPKKYIVPPLD